MSELILVMLDQACLCGCLQTKSQVFITIKKLRLIDVLSSEYLLGNNYALGIKWWQLGLKTKPRSKLRVLVVLWTLVHS